MRCIFCKKDSSDSVSIEHVIPESLGNKKFTLPKGAVCDSCNNYFASKVEKYVLETDEFKNIRSNQEIKNKKGKYQEIKMLIDDQPIRARRTGSSEFEINTEDFDNFEFTINKDGDSQIIIPITGSPPSDHYMSRFLAKMALETLASTWSKRDGWNDYLVDHKGFDPIRKFSRSPIRGEAWEFSKRRIYDEDSSQVHNDGVGYQVLYECDILAIGTPEVSELYFVIAIFGMEYAINLAGSYMGGYKMWLKNNNDVSPLFKKEYK